MFSPPFGLLKTQIYKGVTLKQTLNFTLGKGTAVSTGFNYVIQSGHTMFIMRKYETYYQFRVVLNTNNSSTTVAITAGDYYTEQAATGEPDALVLIKYTNTGGARTETRFTTLYSTNPYTVGSNQGVVNWHWFRLDRPATSVYFLD